MGINYLDFALFYFTILKLDLLATRIFLTIVTHLISILYFTFQFADVFLSELSYRLTFSYRARI